MMYAHFDGMSWPLPDEELAYRLANGSPEKTELLRAASIICAYAELIRCSQAKRNSTCKEIKSLLDKSD